jgi:hypothetical protein
MKAAFRDFLLQRHGASGFLFAFSGAERPFHDLSYPDIQYTLLRPADVTPTAAIKPLQPSPGPGTPLAILPGGVPPRRLFEHPSRDLPPLATEVNLFEHAVGGPYPPHDLLPGPPALMTDMIPDFWLGANGGGDRRQHPAFRVELLTKLMNLSTVRTQQYAVWVTVGFFEVDQEGDVQKALQFGNPDLAMDRLGREVGIDTGTNVRHRLFAIVDRTRATGFNPINPDDFRKLVTYSRQIE